MPSWTYCEIGDYRYAARFLERSKAADGSCEFHAVVRGFVLETRELPLVPFEAKLRGPAARTGIAAARAVDNHSHALLVCLRIVLLSTELAQDERRDSRGRAT